MGPVPGESPCAFVWSVLPIRRERGVSVLACPGRAGLPASLPGPSRRTATAW